MSDIDRGVANRIDLIVNEANYRNTSEAIGDAWRVALLASVPGAARARERARAEGERRVTLARDPRAPRPRTARRIHVVLFVVAILVGIMGVALITPSPRGGGSVMDLQHGALIAGLVSLAAAACFWWLEPYRASGDLGGSRVPPGVNLFFAVFWLGIAVSGVAFRSHEIDHGAELAPFVGLALLGVAGIGEIVLWIRGRRADLRGRRSGTGHTALRPLEDRDDRDDDDAVMVALDEWWTSAGADAQRTDPARLASTRAAVLRHLTEMGWMTAADLQRALPEPAPTTWKERRP